MARGWESKSIESQQEDRAKPRDARQTLSPEAQERARQRAAVDLQRARVLDELSRTTAPVRRAALESALAQLDGQLRAFDES